MLILFAVLEQDNILFITRNPINSKYCKVISEFNKCSVLWRKLTGANMNKLSLSQPIAPTKLRITEFTEILQKNLPELVKTTLHMQHRVCKNFMH